MSSTPETPAPLSFDHPTIQAFLKTAAELRHQTRCRSYALVADALTHEHEARVRAEAELAVAKKLADESEAHAQHESKLRDTMQTNCAGWGERIQQAEAERDSLRQSLNDAIEHGAAGWAKAAALSGQTAQAGVKP